MLAGAAIGAGLLGGLSDSTLLAIVGGVVGLALGWAFGKFVPFVSVIADIFG